ncbi:peroxisomal membrane protein pex21 [Maudiozyma exigua]|uniref:Peroxisomal membrane protein pex21 n=1 Tax=Maudiozyma exigua TaxID=34358 RepID=A0A9P7BD09_MAUEX|nr:peroxisomal membrane protein pex21 [Kazachstania exigua]
MSEASCSVDPLQRFATLANNNNNNVGNINDSTSQRNNFNQRSGTEHAFFGNNEVHSSRNENPMIPSFIPITNNTDTNIHSFPYSQQQILVNSSDHDGNDDDISNIFSNVKIHDPLEFSDEYKRFYGNFQNQNRSSTHSSATPVSQRPSIQRFSQFNSQQSHIRQSTLSTNSSPSPYDSTFQLNNNEVHMIDHELDILQNELNQSLHHQMGNNTFDVEQTHFKEVAASIVDVLTPETTRSSSPVNTKLGGSKFMNLMKRVSAGSVTIRRDSPELFTPETDEVVGNEYFPVQDQPNKP